MGVAASTAGPGRQHRDRSYWLGELRVKITEITNEMGVIRKEMDQRGKDESAYVALSKRQSTLSGEVGTLRGHLADLNLMVEKSRMDATAETLERDYEKIRAENERMLKRVDQVFTEKKGKEASCRELERQIAEHYAQAESQLQDLSEDLKATYYELQATNRQYQEGIAQYQEEIKVLGDSIRAMEDELKHDPVKQKVIGLRDQRAKAEKERDRLAHEIKNYMSPADEKEMLKERAKEDTRDIDLLNKQLAELKTAIGRLKEDLEQGASDLAKGDKVDKYRVLLEKDREIQTFIDSYPETKRADEQALAQARLNIVRLLEDISRNLERQHHLPSSEEVQGMQEALQYKVKQKEQSSTTNTRLEKDLEARQSELEKIADLSNKIPVELKQFEEKMETMRRGLEQYQDLEGLKQRSENEKKNLAKERGNLRSRQDALKAEVFTIQSSLEALKAGLSQNPVAAELTSEEQKLQTSENIVFSLNDYIAAKNREANYGQVKQNVNSLVQEINELVIRAAATKY